MSWRDLVACAERPELFTHSEKGGKASAMLAEARKICDRCPVKTQCFEDSLKPMYVYQDSNGAPQPVFPDGIYAGLTREQRKPFVRQAMRRLYGERVAS